MMTLAGGPLLLLEMLLFAPSAGAAGEGTASKPWEQEPTAVLGVELGATLPHAFPDCRRPSADNGWQPPTRVCAVDRNHDRDPDVLLLDGLPWNDMAIGGSVHFFEGKTATILLTPRHLDYAKMRQILISKYGEARARAEHLGVSADYLLSGRNEHSSASAVQIPPGLSEAAKALVLTYAQTLRLLAGKESLVARRSNAVEREWRKEDWINFYDKVRPYL